jgi:pyridoxal phosphate enzyme (YggS family)
MFIKENYTVLKKSLPSEVELVAVSKTKPIADIRAAYEMGHRVFGENKVQEMVQKHEELPEDIQWHMIGHVQSNKIKYMAGFVSLIHGVDKFSTLKEIDKQAKKHNRVISCLLQAKIAKEESKFGMPFDEIRRILDSEVLSELKNVRIAGLMGMASFTEDQQQLKEEFGALHKLYLDLRSQGHKLEVLSMGMSGDYQLAIANGSNMIRVGSAIFGERNYIA